MTNKYWICSVMCDGCGKFYLCDGWGHWTKREAYASVQRRIDEALDNGWTTDGDSLHCPDCLPFEISGITQAAAMVRGESLVLGLIEASVDGLPQ